MITIIINPLSGARGRGDLGSARAALARNFMKARATEARVCISEYPGHAIDLARQALAEGARLVCAWGGDGTVNEVGAVLAHTDVALGVIPSGSGNGFARELGISLNPARALTTALNGHDRLIDAGQIGDRLFFNIAGIGLDAQIAAIFNTRAPQRRGFFRYVFLGWRQLLSYKANFYRVEANGERLDLTAIMIVVANMPQYGNGACVAANARGDDGRLDLVVVRARPMMNAFLLTPRLFMRTLHRAQGIDTRQVTRVTISSRTPLLCHVDGEAFEAGTELVATVRPAALRVRAP